LTAEVANAAPEAFQRWAAGARTAGIGQEKLADILKDVNDRVGDFLTTGGGPIADFFEQVAPKVGVTAEAFARLSGPAALQFYVDTLGLGQQEMTFHLGSSVWRRKVTISASSCSLRTDDRRSFGPIGASSTVSRLRHFATVFGLIPYRRLSSAIEACDRCIAARTACVVAALPWSTWPIAPPWRDGTTIRHHTPGLNS